MDITAPHIAFPALAIGFGVSIILYFYFAKKRKDKWQTLASQLGYEYRDKDPGVQRRFMQFEQLAIGISPRVRHAIVGNTLKYHVAVFEYHYKIKVRNTKKVRNTNYLEDMTVCILHSNDVNLPETFVRPKIILLDGISSLMGQKEIDFDDDLSFSKLFVVQGIDEGNSRKLFDQEFRKLLISEAGIDAKFSFVCCGSNLVLTRRPRLRPDQLQAFIDSAFRIMSKLVNT